MAKRCIKGNFRSLVNSNLISGNDARKALGRIEYTTDLTEAVTRADFVQESVPESLPLKRLVFSKISHLTPREIVIASSSGGFPVSKIQATSKSPERCIVIHPCQIPVHLTRLVEIVPGRRTSERTVQVASDLMKKVGKQPLVMKREVQDYITNRLQFTLFREALDMVGRGIVDAEEVDVALCEFSKAAFCVGLGPFLQAHIHGGPHGVGGIEGCMDYYAKILPDTWRSLAKWTRIPPRVKFEVERSVSRMIRKTRNER